jgi:tyrosine-protein kinase Etk/Wzc
MNRISPGDQNPDAPRHSAPPAEAAEDEIDLRDLLNVLLAGKWWIIGATLLAIMAGAGYALTATPKYRSDVLLQVEEQNASLSGMESLEGLMGKEPEAATQIQILKSRSVVGQAVDKLGLTIRAEPVHFPVVGAAIARRADASEGPAAPWLGLDGYAWGGEEIAVKRLTVAPGLTGKALTLEAGEGGTYRVSGPEGDRLLEGQVGQVARSERTGPDGEPVVELFVSTLEARPGTPFRLVKQGRQGVIGSLQSGLSASEQGDGTGIIRVALEGEDPARIQEILDTLANIYLRQNVEHRSAQAEESLKFLEKQLPRMKADLEGAEQRLSEFRQEHETLDLTVQTEKLLEQLVQIDSRISQLETQRAEASKNFGPRHPKMQAIEAQMAELKKRKGKLENRVRNLPETQQKVFTLRRQVKVNTEVYTTMLNKAEELRVAKAGTVGNVRVVDYAAPPTGAVAPNKGLIGAMSGVLGVFLGVGLVFVRQFFAQGGIEDPNEAENGLGLPVYAVVPHSERMERMKRRRRKAGDPLPLMAEEEPDGPTAEAFRSLRTSLQFGLLEADNNIVLVTSASPGAGKSFVLSNTATVLGQGGQRTLVVDADMRRGHLHEYLGFERSPGLSELLSGSADLAQVTQTWRDGVVDFIPTGTIPPNPSELLMTQRFWEVLEQVQGEYDVVLLDAPPVLAVTDATLMAAHVGATFLVARAGQNQLAELQETVKRLEQHRSRVTGLVFNDLGAHTGVGNYGQYRYHYYNYEYRSAS